MKDTALVVPLYEEKDAVGPLVAEIAAHWRGGEVVFVDDGSTDGTAERVAAAAAAAGIAHRVVRHGRNRGVGAAMRTGFAAARGGSVVVYDADRPYPLADARRLVDALERADVATASPWHEEGGAPGVGPIRALLSRAASFLYRLVLGRGARGIRTFTCAFRAYRRPALDRIEFRSDGFLAAAEILALALRAGLRVEEVPSTLRARTEGRSKMRVVRTAGAHGRLLARLLAARLFPRSAPREALS